MIRMRRYDERGIEMLERIMGLTTVKEIREKIEGGNTIKVFKRG